MKKDRGELIGYNGCYGYNYNLEIKEITINEDEARCPYCKSIAEDILEDCFVQGYRILCNNNRKVIENFFRKDRKYLKRKYYRNNGK